MAAPGPNVIKICKRCGIEYHPKSSRQQCCNKPIKVPCVVCGKLMDQICTFAAQSETCSIECQSKLIMQKREASAKKLTKKCKWCGKEFHPNSVRDIYCEGPHYDTCVICGKQFEINVRGYSDKKTCSDECRYLSAAQNKDIEAMKCNIKKTLMERYGVENPMQIPGVKDKINSTCEQKYGKPWYTQTDAYNQSVQATCMQKYGVTHPLKAKGVRDEIKATNKQKYGAECVFQSDVIKDRIRDTNLIRYGVANPLQNSDVKAKLVQTNQTKYGANSYTASWEHRESLMLDPSKALDYKEFLDNPEGFISSHFDHKPNYAELTIALGVSQHSIETFLSSENKLDIVEQKVLSYFEEELVAILLNIKPDLKLERHNRCIIAPYELDVYLPEYRLAIEMNPTGTHNSTYDIHGTEPLPANYHRMKTDMCESQGIQLFHIFGYEWHHKKNIIVSMLRNLIGCSDKLYGHSCTCKKISAKEAKNFLEETHLKGYVDSNIHYGLYHNDELVQVMAIKYTDRCELTRLASKLNTCVVGGASKLFKQFISEYNPTDIITTSDRAYASSKLYYTLGFKEVSINDEQGVWIRNSDNQAIDASEVTQQMIDLHRCVQVFDSGTITWQWTCN